jgi:clan AA aspartic protease (TIGR02281 family)
VPTLNFHHRCRVTLVLLCTFLAASPPGTIRAEPQGDGSFPTLAAQALALAEQAGIRLIGLDRLDDAPPQPVTGSPLEKIEALLDGYNYVIVEDRLIVLGEKRWVPPPPKETVLNTRRSGQHHVVDAVLVGIDGTEFPAQLMIDTGASVSVLPLSMAENLGLAQDEMTDREVKTVKGMLVAKLGALRAMRLGLEEIRDVEVAFIDDALLGDTRLLGMNVLGRYRMTLDDKGNRVTLSPRD